MMILCSIGGYQLLRRINCIILQHGMEATVSAFVVTTMQCCEKNIRIYCISAWQLIFCAHILKYCIEHISLVLAPSLLAFQFYMYDHHQI
jgi:hypothetical protein